VGPEGDKRWTAILSTDMVNFTAISQEIGPEKTYQLLRRMLGMAEEIIAAHGGHVVDTAGDGLLAAFGAPNALENAPLQSCLAAIAFQSRVEEVSVQINREFSVMPMFRAGIGGGSTMVAHLDAGAIKVIGNPVNKAARLQSLAEPGEIVISDTIQREAEGHIEVADAGLIEVKGFSDPIQIFRLLGRFETRSTFDGIQRRGLTEMVSRQAEMHKALAAIYAKEPHIVVISGAAGIGKSRLTHEVVEEFSNERPVYIGQCATDGQTIPYGPFFDVLRQAGGAEWGADRAAIFASLFQKHPDLADAEIVSQILASDSERRDQTERALKTRDYFEHLVRKVSLAENAIIVIEDAHWIDTASNALLSVFGGSPIKMVVTSRPGFHADWMSSPAAVRIDLEPLGDDEISRVSEGFLEAAISPKLSKLIAEKSEGIPLIAGEIARALDQADRLAETENGLALKDGEGSLLTGNLEQLVLSRVDRLGAAQKSALQVASAIGRDFSQNILDRALGSSTPIADIADGPDLIEKIAPGRWRFSHALIRDAVYDSLLTEQRQAAHQQVAAALIDDERSENWSGIADHLLRSGTPEKAVPYLIRSAGQSLSAYALYEVDHRLETAMSFLEADPNLVDDGMFRDLAVNWLRALHQIGDFGRMTSVSQRVLPRLSQSGYSSALSIVRTLTSIAFAHSRDYNAAVELAQQALDDAETRDDASGAAWAKVSLMRIYDETKWGDLETIERLADEIAPAAEATSDNHLAMSALYLLSSAYRTTGNRRKCLEVIDKIEAFASKHADRRARGYAQWAQALVYATEGNPEEAKGVVATARENVIPGGGDARVVSGIEMFCDLFLYPPDELRQPVRHLRDEARALRDFNIAHAMAWIATLLELKAGNPATGRSYVEPRERCGSC
jgi:class 3 adenylate cyclase/tetratricopeptide (TPR) repeat protein